MPKKWKNKEEYNAYMRGYYWSKKSGEIEKRGGKCEQCGEARIGVLRIVKKKVLCENCIRIKKVEKVESK